MGLLFALGCVTGDLVPVDGGFRHRVHGYALAQPESIQPPWRKVSVKGSEIAYRRAGSALMSLQSGCRRPVAPPWILARHLVIGVPERQALGSGAVQVGPWEGWSQTFDTFQEGIAVRVKTVTIVAGRCAVDWILTSQRGFDEVEPSFDKWWQSFRYEPEKETE